MTSRKPQIMISLALCALACHGGAEAADSDRVTFRAKVVDSQTGEPAAGVCLWNPKQPEIVGVSDERGQVTIPRMSPGIYSFTISGRQEFDASRKKVRVPRDRIRYDANGYARWWSEQCIHKRQRFHEYESGWQRNFDRLDFDIQPKMPLATIKVEKAARIRGKVVDPDGNPVAGATVAPALTGQSNSITGDTRYSFVTNKDGRFEMILPASKKAKYNLIAHDGAYRQWRKWANALSKPLVTQPGQIESDVVLQLRRTAIVRGTVTDLAGAPVAGHKVRVVDLALRSNSYYVPQTKTDKNGRFELKFARPGRQYVQAMHYWRNGPVGPRVGPAYSADPAASPKGSSKLVKLRPGNMNHDVKLVVDVDPPWAAPFPDR